MEILFIWLYDYKNFKRQGFNFSSEFKFHIENVEGNQFELTISKNEKFIDGFFEKHNVLNVTAIIGQNGTGKSNILDFIKHSFPLGYSSFQSHAIIAYRSTNQINPVILLPDKKFTVKVDLTNTRFEIERYSLHTRFTEFNPLTTGYTNAEYIYYSNIADLRNEDIDMQGFYNLSTLALIRSDSKNYREPYLNPAESDSSYNRYRINEIKRNIQFITSQHTNLLNEFPLPEDLFVDILDSDMRSMGNKKYTALSKVLSFFDINKYKERGKNEIFLKNLHISVFLNFFATYKDFPLSGNYGQNIPEPKTGQSIEEFVKSFFISLRSIKYNKEIPIAYHEEKSKAALEFFDFMKLLLEKKLYDVIDNSSVAKSQIRFKVNKNTLEDVTKFLNLYSNLKGLTEFVSFSWRNLSSGEQSFFSFVSRFYHLKHHQIQHEDLKQNLVIMIDEGDVFFHPAWQRKFFMLTIDYLSKLFEDHSLQLIFTSNTPFITSDLPKSNVIFIEKRADQVIVHGPDNNREETFGGNIHTLFSDSFYMEGALMGDFARTKINRVINYLSDGPPEKKQEYKKVIDIIGEPILRRKLQQMWFEKFGDADEQIAELQKRIDELKKNHNDQNRKNN